MLRSLIQALLLTSMLKLTHAQYLGKWPTKDELRLVTKNVYYTTGGDHLHKFAKSKSQYLLVTTKNNTIHLPHLTTTNRYVVPMRVANFSGYGGIDCFETQDTCVICGIGGCFTVKLDSAGYTFDKRYYHNKYQFTAPWGRTYRDFVFDVLALRTTNYFFTVESHVGDNSAGVLRYDLTGESCFTNFTGRLRRRSVDIDEYHLAQHRFTKNLGVTSVGSGHLWILNINDLSTPAKTYEFSPSKGLGFKVGPMAFFEDNFGGPNRMVICNRFSFKNACFSFDYGTGSYRHIYQFDSQGDRLVNSTKPAEHVFVQTFTESRFFVFVYKNTIFIQEDMPTEVNRLDGNDVKEPQTKTLVDYVSASNGNNLQSAELLNNYMLTGYKDGFLYKEAIAINPHEIISIQYSYNNAEPAASTDGPFATAEVCAEACGYWRQKGTDGKTPIHSDNGLSGALANTVETTYIRATQNIAKTRNAGTTELKYIACKYAHRPQDCYISTISGGSCRGSTTAAFDYGFKSNTASDILKCQQNDPGLTSSLGGKFLKPSDVSPYATTGQICTNKTSAKTESVTGGSSSSSKNEATEDDKDEPMSSGTRTALIAGGIALGVLLIGGIIFALTMGGKKKPKAGNYRAQTPMGGYNHQGGRSPMRGMGGMRKMGNNNSLMGNSSMNTNQLNGSQMGAMVGSQVPDNEDGLPMNTPRGPDDENLGVSQYNGGHDGGNNVGVGMVSQYDGQI